LFVSTSLIPSKGFERKKKSLFVSTSQIPSQGFEKNTLAKVEEIHLKLGNKDIIIIRILLFSISVS